MTWAAVAVGAGTAIGGAAGGKKANKGNKASNLQADIANRLFLETDPLRMSLIGRSADFLGVPSGAIPASVQQSARVGSIRGHPIQIDPVTGQVANPGTPIASAASGGGFGGITSTPTYLAFKDTADRTFQQGKENVISRLPSGGALAEALVGLEGQRASTLTQGAGSIYDAELARAMTLATGQTGTALSGLGQAANAQAFQAQAAAQQGAAKSGALGTGLGSYMGYKQNKPAGGA